MLARVIDIFVTPLIIIIIIVLVKGRSLLDSAEKSNVITVPKGSVYAVLLLPAADERDVQAIVVQGDGRTFLDGKPIPEEIVAISKLVPLEIGTADGATIDLSTNEGSYSVNLVDDGDGRYSHAYLVQPDGDPLPGEPERGQTRFLGIIALTASIGTLGTILRITGSVLENLSIV